MTDILSDPEFNAVFVAVSGQRRLIGFVEASLRLAAEGCRPGPIGYIEGWYVEPSSRRKGVGAALVARAEAWASSSGCRQMASDAATENQVGREAHEHLGYEEVNRLAHFRKDLTGARDELVPKRK